MIDEDTNFRFDEWTGTINTDRAKDVSITSLARRVWLRPSLDLSLQSAPTVRDLAMPLFETISVP